MDSKNVHLRLAWGVVILAMLLATIAITRVVTGFTVKDEGVSLGSFQTLDCVGSIITCSDAGSSEATITLDSTALADDYLLNTGDVGTGAYDFGGAAFELPNGANPTVDEVGEVAVDTTSNQFIYYATPTVFVLSPQQEEHVFLAGPGASEDTTFFHSSQAVTITELHAVVVGANPSITWTIRHALDRSAVGSEVVTGGAITTNQTTGDHIVSGFNDPTIPADSWVWIETTAKTGTVDNLMIGAHFTVDRT